MLSRQVPGSHGSELDYANPKFVKIIKLFGSSLFRVGVTGGTNPLRCQLSNPDWWLAIQLAGFSIPVPDFISC